MTLVSKITRLRHPGVLRDFNWPGELPTFGRYNLIYGWNGTGKTTLSNLFRALELRKPAEGEATLVINNAAVAGHNFDKATLPVRVFNRHFVDESVFPVAGGEVPPIFVLGTESAEKQAEVDRLKAELTKKQGDLEAANREKSGAGKVLDKHCIDRATVVRESLRSAGNNSYNNYDKARYRQRAERMISDGDKDRHLLNEANRERLISQSRATLKSSIDEVRYQFPDPQKLSDGAGCLLQRSVVSSAIATLKADPVLSSWTRQGLGLHQERHAEQCLFCEQPLPDGRIAQLEAHFSTEYEQLVRQLDEQITQLQSLVNGLRQVSLPNRAEFYEDLAADYDRAKSTFAQEGKHVKTFMESLVQALRDKKARVFEAVPLTVRVPTIAATGVESINEVIRRHNAACDDFTDRVSSARERLEGDSVADSLDEYQKLKLAVTTAQKGIQQANTSIQQISTKITALEREIVEHREPAEELNRDLHQYLGHSELQLAVKDTGYTITRNGTPARSLSEGEKTAISLLYFLKSLKDRRFDLKDGLVVLDDPVSSLDANALYLAFGYIRLCTEDAAQVITLTHNFAMFRQMRNWFRHLKGQNKNDISKRPARFYMLECALNTDGRRSSICPLDPLLEEFESEYHYLFARVYRRAHEPAHGGLEANYIFPNMARRLLETFLAFRCPQHSGELRQKLKNIDFDETRKLRILRFLHTHSHADAIGDPEHDPAALGEAQAVLTDLLELIKQTDPVHHDAMIALVNPANTEDPEQ